MDQTSRTCLIRQSSSTAAMHTPLPVWVIFDRAARRFKARYVGSVSNSGGILRAAANGVQCHNRTHAVQQTGSLFGGLGGFHNSRQPDREGRAPTGLALDRNVPAHHLAEAFTNREPKARATVLPCGGGISLGEFLEQFAHLL